MLKRCWFLAYPTYTTKRLHTPFEKVMLNTGGIKMKKALIMGTMHLNVPNIDLYKIDEFVNSHREAMTSAKVYMETDISIRDAASSILDAVVQRALNKAGIAIEFLDDLVGKPLNHIIEDAPSMDEYSDIISKHLQVSGEEFMLLTLNTVINNANICREIADRFVTNDLCWFLEKTDTIEEETNKELDKTFFVDKQNEWLYEGFSAEEILQKFQSFRDDVESFNKRFKEETVEYMQDILDRDENWFQFLPKEEDVIIIVGASHVKKLRDAYRSLGYDII